MLLPSELPKKPTAAHTPYIAEFAAFIVALPGVVLYHITMKKLLPLILLFISTSCLNACNMARHEWQLRFIKAFSIPAPIVLSDAIRIVSDRFTRPEVGQIVWVTGSHLETALALALKNAAGQWPAKLTWQPADQTTLANHKLASNTLLLEPGENTIKIALFSDKLSNHRCKQLVLLQEGRLRLAMPNTDRPVAEQYNARTWLSIFFYDLPLPAQILSVAASPINGHLEEIFTNETFVEELMVNELVERRPADYVTPYIDGFPTHTQDGL